MEWQLIGDDEWVFGEKVRGAVRHAVGEVYFDEDREGGWIWFVRLPGETISDHRGTCGTREDAIAAVEKALGIEG